MREMQDVMDIENEVVMDYLHATAYQGHSLGLTILGPEENIKTISRDDLLQYVKTNYTAPRIVLAAAGGVDHDALVASAEKLLGGLSSENTAADLEPSLFTGSQIESRNDDKPLAHFAVAVEGGLLAAGGPWAWLCGFAAAHGLVWPALLTSSCPAG